VSALPCAQRQYAAVPSVACGCFSTLLTIEQQGRKLRVSLHATPMTPVHLCGFDW